MDIIEQIKNLETKLQVSELSPNLQLFNLNQISQEEMDIKEFILSNFVKRENDQLQMDYDKISQSIPYFQEIQQKTCEQIAVSVDLNLDEYVQVSEKLEGLKDSIDHLEQKFNSVQNNIDVTQENLQETIYQVNTIVQNLKLIHSLEKNMKNLKKLLKNLESVCITLEQIEKKQIIGAFYYLKLAYQIISTRENYQKQVEICSHCRNLCTKFEIVQKINEAFNQFVFLLEQELVTVLQSDDYSDLSVLFQSFVVLNRLKNPEKIIIQFILKPQIDQYYANLMSQRSNLIKPQKSESNISNPLEKFTSQIIQLYNTKGVEIEQALEQLPNQFFSIKQMLMELVYIYLSQKECAFIYSVGVPDLFLRHYLTIMNLKDELKAENNNSDPEKKFYDKWNLNTYYSMRYNQIVRSYESQMNELNQRILKYQQDNLETAFQSNLKRILQSHLEQCLSPNVFVHYIGMKFIRLLFQIVNRFYCQIQEMVKNYQLNEYQHINYDLTSNLCDLWQSLPRQIYQKIMDYYPEKEEQASQIQVNISNQLQELTSLFLDITIQPIINQCCQNLEPFHGVPAKFRMTNREVPTDSSNFTGNIFRPLQNYLSKSSLHQSVQELIQFKVSNQVYQKFKAIKEEVLQGCEKQEKLMQKLGVQMEQQSEMFKIKKQFELDTVEIQTLAEQKFKVQLV